MARTTFKKLIWGFEAPSFHYTNLPRLAFCQKLNVRWSVISWMNFKKTQKKIKNTALEQREMRNGILARFSKEKLCILCAVALVLHVTDLRNNKSLTCNRLILATYSADFDNLHPEFNPPLFFYSCLYRLTRWDSSSFLWPEFTCTKQLYFLVLHGMSCWWSFFADLLVNIQLIFFFFFFHLIDLQSAFFKCIDSHLGVYKMGLGYFS